MKKRSSRWGCLLAGALIMILLLGGSLWYLRSQTHSSALPSLPPSPILVYLISPPAGDEVDAGDFVTVLVKAVAPERIQSTELFVDGQSLGAVADSPQDAAWSWQALPLGLHTLLARSTGADGKVGESQAVVINVLAGDGLMQVPASGDQTITELGAGFGVPPDQMAAANPHLNPALPLADGQPVQVPVNGANAGNGGGAGGSGKEVESSPIFLISWQFKPIEPVDQSYCYTSTGDGVWQKMPKPPFEFFSQDNFNYLQSNLFITTTEIVIQMQCWGWQAGALKYLGQGEAKFKTQPPPDQVTINGDGFAFVGVPHFETIPDIGGGTKVIPPPFAVREAAEAGDCTAHAHPLLGPFICNTLMNAPVKEYLILEWEWQPGVCWPGDCPWINDIDGYHIYEIDPGTQARKYIKDVNNSSQKVAALPLEWLPSCYGVRAYVNDPTVEDSAMAIYCPGQPPAPQKLTLTPEDWLTTGGNWFQSGGCDNFGQGDYYTITNTKTGFGNQGGEVLVGSYEVDTNDCFRDGSYAAGVKFSSASPLPPNAVLQHAELTFSRAFMDYGATGWANPVPTSCVASVGKAKQDWSGLVDGDHFAGTSVSLISPDYNAPIASLMPFMGLTLDVTAVMNDWIKHPQDNHGFILSPASMPHPKDDGTGSCLSGLGNFQLNIYFFAP